MYLIIFHCYQRTFRNFHLFLIFCCSVAQSCPTLWPHGLQHARLPCPSLSPGVCSNSCPLSQWCWLTISSSAAPFSFLPSILPSIRVFSDEVVLCIRWPKYWSFSFNISPSNEYSALIFSRIDYTMTWMAYTTELYFLTALKAGSMRSSCP